MYGLSCFPPQFIKRINTGTDKDIEGERGPVLLALTLELVENMELVAAWRALVSCPKQQVTG